MSRTGYRRLGSVIILLLVFVSGCRLLSASPSARYGAEMAYDAAEQRIVMFGGRAEGLFGMRYFGDLWSFEMEDRRWVRIRTTGDPPRVLSPGLAYDVDSRVLLVFGGHDSTDRVDGTWCFDFSTRTWEALPVSDRPAARSDFDLVRDPETGSMVLFSGYCLESAGVPRGDTWSYHPDTGSWIPLDPSTSPPAMYGHSMVYLPLEGCMLLWGGHIRDESGASGGYNEAFWRYDSLNNAWGDETVDSGRTPPARYWHQASAGEDGRTLLVFGGNGSQGFLGDTWIFDFAERTWHQVAGNPSPSPRVNAAMCYDPGTDRFVLFGGLGPDMQEFDDTWIFDPSTAVWERLE